MKDFVFVEFLFRKDEDGIGMKMIAELGEDFVMIKNDIECDGDPYGYVQSYRSVTGKIYSAAATAIKLSDPFLADRMRVSYISDDLKDKYRK